MNDQIDSETSPASGAPVGGHSPGLEDQGAPVPAEGPTTGPTPAPTTGPTAESTAESTAVAGSEQSAEGGYGPESSEAEEAGGETGGESDEASEAGAARGEAGAAGSTDLIERLENEGDVAADYLEELLDIADLDGDLDIDVEGDRASVSIVGADLSQLVGRHGEVLEALQELTRLAVYRETGERSRLMLDIGGFRATKRSRLERVAAEAIAEVKASGERKALEPMTPFERKVVHDAVAAAGLASQSEGEEPRRRVVVLPR